MAVDILVCRTPGERLCRIMWDTGLWVSVRSTDPLQDFYTLHCYLFWRVRWCHANACPKGLSAQALRTGAPVLKSGRSIQVTRPEARAESARLIQCLVSPNLDALWGCQLPAASIKLSSLAAGRAPDPLCFTLVSQVHRFSISGLVRRVSGGAAGMEKRLIRELLSVCGGVWLWSGTATAAVALGLILVSTRTSFRFQGSSGRLSPGNSYVLTDLRFCTSSSLPTQTAVDQAGTLHLFPGEAANAVKQLWESSWCPWDGAFRVMPSGWCPESDALLIL